ncbi:SMI1/KNR4 family protein [Streptomyces melanogenes]|uniref:SMI1/KNR4 family protein n=1 Tax=Streptomyces melanogenes TaxID=67326 RepID=UPI0037B56658
MSTDAMGAHAAVCPAARLLPQGSVRDTGAVLAGARAVVAEARGDRQRRAEVGEVLLHVLTHGHDARPRVAEAITVLTPEQVPAARALLAGYLADRNVDPNALRGDPWWDENPPEHERLYTLVALTLLDRSYLGAAEDAYRAVGAHTAAGTATAYALLGPEHESEAVARLSSVIADEPAGSVVGAVRALLTLGLDADAADAVRACMTRGVVLAGLVRPLNTASPRVLPDLIEAELRALMETPGWHLAERGKDDPDTASEVLSCGAEYGERVAAALWQLVESDVREPEYRWRAAVRLGLLSPAERERAVGFLEAAGVVDPEAPRGMVGTPALAEGEWVEVQGAVAAAWRRIELQLAERFPQFAVHLGGPATPAEIAACEAELGFGLPPAFVASCLIHRSVGFGGWVTRMCPHDDIRQLPENRDGQVMMNDGWTSDTPDDEIRQDRGGRQGWVPLVGDTGTECDVLDLEPAAAGRYGQIVNLDHGCPNGVQSPGWLELLERFADDLEADRYVLDQDSDLTLR